MLAEGMNTASEAIDATNWGTWSFNRGDFKRRISRPQSYSPQEEDVRGPSDLHRASHLDEKTDIQNTQDVIWIKAPGSEESCKYYDAY